MAEKVAKLNDDNLEMVVGGLSSNEEHYIEGYIKRWKKCGFSLATAEILAKSCMKYYKDKNKWTQEDYQYMVKNWNNIVV